MELWKAGWGSDGRGFAWGGYAVVAWSVAGKQAAERSQRPERSQKSWSARPADGTDSYSEYARISARI